MIYGGDNARKQAHTESIDMYVVGKLGHATTLNPFHAIIIHNKSQMNNKMERLIIPIAIS